MTTAPSAAGPGTAAPVVDRALRRERFGWYSYDWAMSVFNTSVTTVFLGPYLTAVAEDGAGPDGRLLVCDSYNGSLRWLDRAERRVTTWVRGLHEPGGVALGARGAYVADTNAHRVAIVDWGSEVTRTLEIVL